MRIEETQRVLAFVIFAVLFVLCYVVSQLLLKTKTKLVIELHF